MEAYTTFLRSCRTWQEFANAEKEIQETGLTYQEARNACDEFNRHRSEAQIDAGTKLEFTADDNL